MIALYQRVFSAPAFGRIWRLRLRGRFRPDALEPLRLLPALTELDVSRCHWPGGLRGIPGYEFLSRLTSFEAGHNDLLSHDPWDPSMENSSIAALAESPLVANLRHLGLAGNCLTRQDARSLLESPHLGRLTSLDLRDNRNLGEYGEALRRRFGPGVRL
jgi:hypothetical protein